MCVFFWIFPVGQSATHSETFSHFRRISGLLFTIRCPAAHRCRYLYFYPFFLSPKVDIIFILPWRHKSKKPLPIRNIYPSMPLGNIIISIKYFYIVFLKYFPNVAFLARVVGYFALKTKMYIWDWAKYVRRNLSNSSVVKMLAWQSSVVLI